MELTVLADDNISENKRLLAEHGLCFYIEDSGRKILFDTGHSDVFIKNAINLGINLFDLDYIVLSHGHYDHTWGLTYYMAFYISALLQKQKAKKPTIITHPDTFLEKFEQKRGQIGCILKEKELQKYFNIVKTKTAYNLTESLTFLGEIPRLNDFEAKEPLFKVLKNKKYEDDYITEDSALAYKFKNAITVITGCSHSGICNIIEHSKNICNENKVDTVIGGFHLIDTSKDKMDKIIKYLKMQKIKNLYPCHCTDFNAKTKLRKELSAKNIGVGFKYKLCL